MPDLASRDREFARSYLAAFLSPARAHRLLAELEGGSQRRPLLVLARQRLHAELAPSLEDEILVLIEDLRLPPAEVAGLVGLDVETVHSALATDAPAVEPQPQRVAARGRWLRRLVGAATMVAAVVVGLVWSLTTAPPPDACARADAQVCIADARMTSTVDASGEPGPAATTFQVGEPVKLWFAYERLTNDPVAVEAVWLRAEGVLYATTFPLPASGTANVTMAALHQAPGEHWVQIRRDGEVLVEERFALVE